MLNNIHYANMVARDINSGYWSVKDHYFFHKADAFRAATKMGTREVGYHFFDDEFDTVDWTQEPPESYETLCRERAQQLRDQYRYLALSYSGGADSTTVLETFLKNGIHLDEVVTYFPVKEVEATYTSSIAQDRSSRNYRYEYLLAVKPRLAWLAQNYPQVKITVLDVSEPSIAVVEQSRAHETALAGLIMTPTLIGQRMLRDHMERHGPEAATIHGIDKPRVSYEHATGRFYSSFYDFNTTHGHWDQRPGRIEHPRTEYFYYAPSMPKIVVKAAHMVRRAVEPALGQPRPYFIPRPGVTAIDVHHDLIKRVLYPHWDTSVYQVEKCANFLWIEYTDHMFRRDSRWRDYWQGQLDEFVWGIDPQMLIRDPDGRLNKLRDCWSRRRYLS